ncbi:hypothetical protein [Desulfosarcina ovata]|uniref:Uncharacterized protein n=2 Tax=Desulfosarcina ovata TaxID=83564 RepID=A0A5K8AEX8_9BACT|nr:hypothetical protein [Desulfosarcina ovata]BBO84709.1 hypothetical protein DSCO28_52750 [Desulfosarcina ovata subsp. sediminis]BBO91202.1 hypothetical protein DSCOOX_43820 [Desulfosarcina ovata subsp. ovata]
MNDPGCDCGPVLPAAIIDASSAILLFKAELIADCCAMLQLFMTRSVFKEVTVPDRPGADGLRRLVGRRSGFRLLGDPMGALPARACADLQRLHQGERDTLHHYLNGRGRFVIIDDGKAVKVCRRQGIFHINALLCPRLLFFCGRLPEDRMHRHFARLAALGRYARPVMAWAAACSRSDLAYFMDGQ